MAKDALADMVAIAAICKIENDFILSLRTMDLRTGVTRICSTRRTRLVTRFAGLAAAQVKELFEPQPPQPSDAPATNPAPPAKDDEIVTSAALRQACLAVKADKFFPSLWERAEKLQEKPATAARSSQDYYLCLLNLCALAADPPPDMLFVPGGWVSVDTSAGKRKLWVEPFFADRCEVTVAQYAKFLKAAEASDEWRSKMRLLTPITRGVASLNREDLPVTGVTFAAAEAYAAWRGARLPTLLQWLRVAGGDDDRAYPCGAACKGVNVKGADDGWETLAAAAGMQADKGPFGHLGLAGNVREWTCTWITPDAYSRTPAEAPAEPATGTLKAQCGGSWRLAADQARCGVFGRGKPGEASDDVGFRCIMPFEFPSQDPNKTAQDARP
jgi:formylglycine-generating enzyme required for sulfatase activity